MITELRLANTYKFLLEDNESRTLYEWRDDQQGKSYFTSIDNHHILEVTGKYCLGHTKEEALINLKKLVEDYNRLMGF